MAIRRSASVTAGNSSTPDGTRKHLNPRTPAATRPPNSETLPGTTPPQNPTSTQHRPSAARRLASSPAIVVVAGMLLSGMSTIVVTPPAAAAVSPCRTPPTRCVPARSRARACRPRPASPPHLRHRPPDSRWARPRNRHADDSGRRGCGPPPDAAGRRSRPDDCERRDQDGSKLDRQASSKSSRGARGRKAAALP